MYIQRNCKRLPNYEKNRGLKDPALLFLTASLLSPQLRAVTHGRERAHARYTPHTRSYRTSQQNQALRQPFALIDFIPHQKGLRFLIAYQNSFFELLICTAYFRMKREFFSLFLFLDHDMAVVRDVDYTRSGSNQIDRIRIQNTAGWKYILNTMFVNHLNYF